MEEYYTVKEILLGLRQEQVRIAEELKQIEKMLTTYKNDKYQGSHFTNAVIGEYKSLFYQLCCNYTFIEKLCYLKQFNESLFRDNSVWAITEKDDKDNYILYHNTKNLVKEGMQESFNEKVESILNDKFVNEIYLSHCSYKSRILDVKCVGLNYLDNDASFINNIIDLKYQSRNDELSLEVSGRNRHRTLSGILDEVLNVKIPKKYLREYIQEIIETNPETKKEIYIPNERLVQDKNSYYLNQEKENYVLVKKRK